MEFVHLHVLSNSSVFRSTLQYDEIFQHTPVIAMTDDHWVQIFDFHDAPYDMAKKLKEKKGIDFDTSGCKPIFGFKARVENIVLTNDPPQEIIFIAKTRQGFKNLMKLTSFMHLSENGFLSWDTISQYKEDIICISGSITTEIGFVVYRNVNPDPIVDFLKEKFGDDLYLEIQEHFLAEPWEHNATQYCLNRVDVPVVLTNEVRYLRKEDAKHSCIYFFSSPKLPMTMEKARFTYCDEFYLKTPEEMLTVVDSIMMSYNNGFRAMEGYSNTVKIASQIEKLDLKEKESHMPYVENADQKLREMTFSRLPLSYPETYEVLVEGTNEVITYKNAVERIEYELNEIKMKDYSGYFLILEMIIHFCIENDILIAPGRGSAVGSSVLYTNWITHCDPLKYNLLFERFLNPRRVSEPDVDVDIESSRRGEVLEFVVNKFGKERIAQIITAGTLSARSAFHAVAKAFSFSLKEEDRIAKLIPNYPEATIRVGLYGDGKSIQPDTNLVNEYNTNFESRELLDYALWIEDRKLINKFGIHAGGVVISKDDLFDFCPMVKGDKLETCVAMTMKRVEKHRLVKYDLLGVKMLDVLKKGMKKMGLKSFRDVPMEDSNVFQYLASGNSFGIFQFNKVGEILNKLRVNSIGDLTVINALNRPGPMAEIPKYIARKHGEAYEVFDPRLKHLLDPTKGIMVYQETIMQVSQVMCGYDLGEADNLRRAIGKKDRELILKLREEFIERAVANGFSLDVATKIYDLIEFFCDYGFNKSHALAYAVTAYVCAYFKYYIPVHYMSAMLEAHQDDNEDADNSPFYLRVECEKMGIDFMPPDINESDFSYSPYRDESVIQYGLSSLKNVGPTQAVKIVENRPYRTFDEFIQKSGVSNRTAESLIKAGSFDLLQNRTELLSYFDQYADVASASENQYTLFDLFDDEIFDEKEPYTTLEILEFEKEVLGTYLSDHPMKHYQSQLKVGNFSTIYDIMDNRILAPHTGCIISKLKPWKKKNGCFGVIEDHTGTMNCTIFSSTFEKLGIVNMKDICGKPIILEGKYNIDENRFIVKDAYFMKEKKSEIIINIQNLSDVTELERMLKSSKDGQVKIMAINPSERRIVYSRSIILTDSKRELLRNKFGEHFMVKEVS